MKTPISSIIRSRLSLKLFAGIIPTICMLLVALYAFSVPLIKRAMFEQEENAGRAVLDTVFELASRINLNLELQRELTLEAHKTRLRNIIEITSGYIDAVAHETEAGTLTKAAARQQIYDTLRRFQYGHNDYVWVSDYSGQLVSHPNPQLHGKYISREVDQNDELVIPKIVEVARSQGEGYYEYLWSRLGGQQPIPKISYFKDFPEWSFVVGTGVYLDDVKRDVERRKSIEIQELRDALRDIKIGRTGYLYIFDSDYRMVIHPNPNIEGTYFGELVDPISLKPIGSEIAKIADTDQGRFYKWDKPDDPGNYVYDKISWVRHFDAFNWYIASSAYVSEFKEGSELLGNRILLISVSFLLLSLFLSYLFVRRITDPLRHLAVTAARVQSGDLSARSGISGTDEIAMLSGAFDNMVVRLHRNIGNLDATVRERTSELQESNTRLTSTVKALESVRSDLAQAEMRQRVILDAIPAYVAQVDNQFRILFVNQRYADLFGTNKEALIGQSLLELSGWQSQPEISETLDAAQNGETRTFTHRLSNGGGTDWIMKTTLIPAGLDSGEVGLFVLALDVTEEKKAQKQFLEMQRISAGAQLATGLTHDFNNLLAIILGNLTSAQEHYSEIAGIDDYLDPAIRAARRGADIMGRLLAFARSQPLEPTAIEAGRLLYSISQLLKRSLPNSIQLDVAETGSFWVFADPVQLENAIINLALNAKDAMPEGGRLSLSVAKHYQPTPTTENNAKANAGLIEIKVSDTGHGFSPEVLERAFEPFFTTKKTGSGSGLGLSMVFGFVKQSGGHIDIQSTVGRGTTITILLPVAKAENRPDHLSDEVAAVPEWRGKLAIVVEDEAEVRDIVRRQLVELGFSVVECVDADEADQLFPGIDDLFLLVSDIVMPAGMSGFDLADHVRASRHDVAIVLMTGFVSVDERLATNQHRLTILRKPFDKSALCRAITRATKTISSHQGHDND